MLNTHLSATVLPTSSTPSAFRQITESLTLLAVAVTLFRGFAAEGYLITTGSMAPTLLGNHHHVVCPGCSFEFACGAPVDDSETNSGTAWANFDLNGPVLSVARCPNCGYETPSVDQFPRTAGDQLLVHKHAYEFRDPRRWEVIVFRNPADPRQAYVKRVIGLPGETIEIRNGDIYVNGNLARKSYRIQKSVCIPVSDYARRADSDDPDCLPGWVRLSHDSRWQMDSAILRHTSSRQGHAEPIQWIGYRHTIRQGGNHLTAVPLAAWPSELAPLDDSSRLQYENGQLQIQGVFTELEYQRWKFRSDEPAFQAALKQLCEKSHIAPLIDEYGYNSTTELESQPLDDFLISLVLKDISGDGRFEIELSDGEHVFSLVLRFDQLRVELLKDGDPVPLRRKSFSPELLNKPLKVDFSLIDDQAVVALDDQEFLEPYTYKGAAEIIPMSRPVRFGAAGITCEVCDLKLFRDLHYTSRHPPDEPEQTVFQLGEDEFFVLGDNSPVSVDSRVWDDPAVPRSALIGKPLVVHLPSKVKRYFWGGKPHDLRLPDFSRVRVIR